MLSVIGALILTARIKKAGTFEAQNAARAPANALTACQTVPVYDRYTRPGVPANVNTDRAVIRANTALNTPGRVWNNLARDQRLTPGRFFL
jgi:hypothetical protein